MKIYSIDGYYYTDTVTFENPSMVSGGSVILKMKDYCHKYKCHKKGCSQCIGLFTSFCMPPVSNLRKKAFIKWEAMQMQKQEMSTILKKGEQHEV